MKCFRICACALLLAAGAGAQTSEAADFARWSEEQDYQEIEEYVNQKDEYEARKEQSKRGIKAKKPMLPIYSVEK